MKRIIFKQEDLSSLPSPEAGYLSIGVSENGGLSTISPDGTISAVGGGSSLDPTNTISGFNNELSGGYNNTIGGTKYNTFWWL